MSIRTFAYGLLASAMFTGGVAIYYTSNPGIGVTADDVAELMEGLNERSAALATSAHTYDSNGWNFAEFAYIASLPVHAQIQEVADKTLAIIPHYYQSNGIPWTVSNLFKVAQIGDGTNKWTVAWTGAPIYGNTIGPFIITNTLWEIKTALAYLQITARTPVWQGGPSYTFGATNIWIFDDEGDNLYLKVEDGPQPSPHWWTNMAAHQNQWQVYTGAAGTAYADGVYGAQVVYRTNGVAAGNPHEDVILTAPDTASGSRGTWSGDHDYWLYTLTYEESPQTAYRLDASGGVWMVSMASGCTAVVSMPWVITQSWSMAEYGASTVAFANYEAGTSDVSLAFSGVATGWFGFVQASVPSHDLTALVGPYSDYEASGYWTNSSSGEFLHLPPPRIEGHSLIDFSGPAYIQWTFTRCRP